MARAFLIERHARDQFGSAREAAGKATTEPSKAKLRLNFVRQSVKYSNENNGGVLGVRQPN